MIASVADQATMTGARQTRSAAGPIRVAYIVSRFPRLTETFVVEEVHAVLRAGAEVDLYPLHRERTDTVQPAAQALATRVHHHALLSPAIFASQWHFLRKQPRNYLAAAAAVVRHNWGSRRLLLGGVAAFPLAAHLARTVEKTGVTHVHAHFATHPALVAYVINRLTGVPFSFTAHGSDLHRDRHMLAEKVRLASLVVAISEFNKQVILDECGSAVADRVEVIHCGVDREVFSWRASGTRPDGPLRLCCVGTLHEVKGQSVLIAACARLHEKGVPVTLTLIGDGPDEAQLRDQVEQAGLTGLVRLAGALTRPQVRAELDGADVLVAPSVPTADGRREGLPVVLLEAMAVGVPVVASRLSGIPEAVIHEETGLLVDPGDVDGLVSAIRRLANDRPLGSALAASAHRHLVDEFDLDESAHRLVAAFRGGEP